MAARGSQDPRKCGHVGRRALLQLGGKNYDSKRSRTSFLQKSKLNSEYRSKIIPIQDWGERDIVLQQSLCAKHARTTLHQPIDGLHATRQLHLEGGTTKSINHSNDKVSTLFHPCLVYVLKTLHCDAHDNRMLQAYLLELMNLLNEVVSITTFYLRISDMHHILWKYATSGHMTCTTVHLRFHSWAIFLFFWGVKVTCIHFQIERRSFLQVPCEECKQDLHQLLPVPFLWLKNLIIWQFFRKYDFIWPIKNYWARKYNYCTKKHYQRK